MQAVVAQLVEHAIGNDEVTGSIPVNGSIYYAKVVQWQNTAFVKQERESDSLLWLIMEKNIEDLKKELEVLEAEMISADFWVDKDKAQATIRRIADLKVEIEGVGKYDKGLSLIHI